MSSGSKSSFSCWRTSMASRKPIFSNALFHSRMPSRTEARYSSGTDFSIQKTIFFFGGRQLVGLLRVDRLGPLQPPAVDVADEGGVLAVGAEVLDDAEEVADAVVGEARLVAAVGQLAQAVVDDDGVCRGASMTLSSPRAAAAGEGGGHLQLDVARERLDLVPGAAVGVEVAEAQLGEVGHEDVVEVDAGRCCGSG